MKIHPKSLRRPLIAADLFCGAGGTSAGLVAAGHALGREVRLTAINHWDVAVTTHSANHPTARHLCTGVDNVNPRDLYAPNELEMLWASPECTHHSRASGGKPVNEQSRATAWCVTRWAEALRPGVILVENVPEFITWGPCDRRGKPLVSRKGEIFQSWVATLRAIGYTVEWRELCAADYGDPTSRRRLFVQAVRGRRRIVWPTPTHHNPLTVHSAHPPTTPPWVPAREIIDWTNRGESIYHSAKYQKKPLAPKTMRRILLGLEKYGLAPFLVPQQRGGQPVASVHSPLNTITAQGRGNGIAQPYLVHMKGQSNGLSANAPLPSHSGNMASVGVCDPYLVAFDHQGSQGSCASSADAPLGTVTTKQRHCVAQPYLVKFHGDHAGRADGDGRALSVEEPLSTLPTANRLGLAQPFLKYYGPGDGQTIDAPLDTVTTKHRFGLCQPRIEINGEMYLIDIDFRMLQWRELSLGQGFPKDYNFTGNITEKVAQVGNAVPCGLARALVQAVLSQNPNVSTNQN